VFSAWSRPFVVEDVVIVFVSTPRRRWPAIASCNSAWCCVEWSLLDSKDGRFLRGKQRFPDGGAQSPQQTGPELSTIAAELRSVLTADECRELAALLLADEG